MGTIVSLWRYDVAACVAPQSPKARQLAILRYASRGSFAAHPLDWPQIGCHQNGDMI
jgi:hypothetical protein